jgi:hypothetical protein
VGRRSDARSRSAISTNGWAALCEFGEGRHQPGVGCGRIARLDHRQAIPGRRSSGHEGLGVGVFIALAPIARAGATLQFGNRKRGACAPIRWRIEAWEGDAAES